MRWRTFISPVVLGVLAVLWVGDAWAVLQAQNSGEALLLGLSSPNLFSGHTSDPPSATLIAESTSDVLPPAPTPRVIVSDATPVETRVEAEDMGGTTTAGSPSPVRRSGPTAESFSPDDVKRRLIEDVAGQIGDLLELTRKARVRAEAARDAGDIRGALVYLEHALSIVEKAESKGLMRAKAMSELGDAMAETGHTRRAREVLEKAVALSDVPGGEGTLASSLYRLGREQLLDDQAAAALLTFQRALPIAMASPSLRTELHLSAARAAELCGRLHTALRHAERGARLLSEQGDVERLQIVRSQAAGLHVRLGHFEDARRLYQRMRAVHEAAAEPRYVAYTDGALGDLFFQQGQYGLAAQRYDLAAQTWERLAEPRGAILNRCNEAWALERLGRYDEAARSLQRALQLVKHYQLREEESAVTARLGRAYLKLGMLEEAQLAFVRAGSLRSLSIRSAGWIPPLGIAQVQEIRGDPKALASYELALSLLDRSSQDAVLDPIEAPWLEEHRLAYQRMISHQLEAGAVEEALEVTGRAHARLFKDLVATRAGSALLGPLARRHDSTLDHEEGARRRVSELAAASLNGRETSARTGPVAPLVPLDLEGFKAVAQGFQATLVIAFELPEQVSLWVVRPSGQVDHRMARLDLAQLQQLIRQTMVSLNHPPSSATHPDVASRDGIPGSSRLPGQSAASLEGLLETLYDALIDPVAPLLSANPLSRLVFVTDGLLSSIPWPALIDADGHLLLEHHPIIATPMARLLIANEGGTEGIGTHPLRVIGASPDAEVLVAELRQGAYRAAPQRVVPTLGQEATQAALNSSLSGPDPVQLGGRGYYHYDHPWLSGVLTAAEDVDVADQDGVSALVEWSWGGKRSPLLVLPPFSGNPEAIDQVFGLQLGALSAGGLGVIQPLGQKALTGVIADRFYRALLAGRPPPEALREAQMFALGLGMPLVDVAGFLYLGAL